MTNELEQRARMFVAAQYEDDPTLAQVIFHGKTTSVDIQRGIAAVAAALRSVEQPNVSALEVFRIAGGDTECTPNPSANEAMESLRDLRACYDEALSRWPIAQQTSAPCPCGLSTCVEPWEPGCGLGNSEQHAIAVPSAPEPVAWMLRNSRTGSVYWDAEVCVWRCASYANDCADDMNDNIDDASFEVFPLYANPPAPRSDDAQRESAASEAAQEPIAWADFDDGKLIRMWSTKWLGAHPDRVNMTPLYTHPAPLRPVTDEDALWVLHGYLNASEGNTSVKDNIHAMRKELESFCVRLGEGA